MPIYSLIIHQCSVKSIHCVDMDLLCEHIKKVYSKIYTCIISTLKQEKDVIDFEAINNGDMIIQMPQK